MAIKNFSVTVALCSQFPSLAAPAEKILVNVPKPTLAEKTRTPHFMKDKSLTPIKIQRYIHEKKHHPQ